METTEKDSVRADIKNLQVGESLTYPASRYDYIASCRSRLQQLCEQTQKWRLRTSKDRTTVTITRYI